MSGLPDAFTNSTRYSFIENNDEDVWFTTQRSSLSVEGSSWGHDWEGIKVFIEILGQDALPIRTIPSFAYATWDQHGDQFQHKTTSNPVGHGLVRPAFGPAISTFMLSHNDPLSWLDLKLKQLIKFHQDEIGPPDQLWLLLRGDWAGSGVTHVTCISALALTIDPECD